MPLEIQIQKSIAGPDTGAVTIKLTGSKDTAEMDRYLVVRQRSHTENP